MSKESGYSTKMRGMAVMGDVLAMTGLVLMLGGVPVGPIITLAGMAVIIVAAVSASVP